jgi:hypothetical protein
MVIMVLLLLGARILWLASVSCHFRLFMLLVID